MRIPILDHGYIELVESWGSDERIIESARMSTAKGFNGWGPKCRSCGDYVDTERDCPSPNGTPYVDCGKGGHYFDAPGDEALLAFLWRNKHTTPFEMAGAIIEVKAPIMVFREWHRHRTQSYNEQSARYTPLPNENYLPTTDRLMVGSDGKNRQAGTIAGAEVLTLESALEWLNDLDDVYDHAQRVYEDGLRRGVPKELARLPVPVARYSRMRAQALLLNWLKFEALRSTAKNPHAQYEIRVYADALHDILVTKFPRTMALFDGGVV